jgi:hypothetical protein
MPLDRLVSGHGSQGAPVSRYQVKDKDDDCHNDQKVNQTTAYMEREAQQPQNQKNDKDCPEHFHPSRAVGALESKFFRSAHEHFLSVNVSLKRSPVPLHP